MAYLIILALSLLFSFLIIIPELPYSGLALVFVTLASCILHYKEHKDIISKVIYILLLILSFCLVWRVNNFLFFLNSAAVIYLGSYLIISKKNRDELSFPRILFLPLKLLIDFIRTTHDFKFDSKFMQGKIAKNSTFAETLLSIVVSFIVLIIIIPLLSYVNPIFSRWVTTIYNILNLNIIVDKLFGDSFVILFARSLLFLLFFFFIPKLLAYVHNESEQHLSAEKISLNLSLLIPKILIIVVLGIFFISQAQLYFANEATLNSLGIMHSQYAREVFGQLSVVTLVIFFLVYNDKKRDKLSQYATYILLVEAIFLTTIALKSVFDYSQQWGFTYKRLYGFAGVIWLYGVVGIFSFYYIKTRKAAYFIRDTVLFSTLILITINAVNFDYLIYHYAKSRTGEGVDHLYLSSLTADALSYDDQLTILQHEIEKDKIVNYDKTGAAYNILWKVEKLQNKYKHFDLRSFNSNEYRQYLQIKNLDVKKYREFLDTKYNNNNYYPH